MCADSLIVQDTTHLDKQALVQIYEQNNPALFRHAMACPQSSARGQEQYHVQLDAMGFSRLVSQFQAFLAM
jgi:hypothetical protein